MAKHLIKCLVSIVLLTFFTENTALLENNVYFCTEIFKNISKYDKSVFTYTGHTEKK